MASRCLARSFGPVGGARGLTAAATGLRSCSNPATPRQSKVPKRPAPSSTHDWIGPPHPLSNLRPIVYQESEGETALEKCLRSLRQETEDWNHHFWTNQNVTFSKEKEAFIISQLKAKGLSVRDEQGRRRTLSSEEMAQFYKSFLDRNRERHAGYNREWYRRNFTITFLMLRVFVNNTWRRVTHKHSSPPTGR